MIIITLFNLQKKNNLFKIIKNKKKKKNLINLFFSISVSVPAHQGALGVSIAHEILSTWQIFTMEFVLSFLIVFTVFATLDPSVKTLGSDSLSIGLAYLVCSLAGVSIH